MLSSGLTVASNKDKIRASAQKFLQKGQIDKAIREYQRLVEEDPKDVRTLLKIGDLQTRIGSNSEATTTYGLVAQFYSEQGFFLKAVAVYKQILKLDPNLIETNLKLADLYHQLGLMSDAANQYRQISQLYEQSGRVEDSIKVLQRMVELDPENVASRIKLAEVYAKQNMLEDARTEFTRAAQFLKSAHRVDDYVKVAERIIHFDPNDLRTTKELANIYIQKGDPRRALAKLQVCFKANPKDIETLNLLAAAFKDLEQPQKTISVYRELARIHEAAGDSQSFQSVMRRILAIDPDDVEARQALGAGARPPPPIRQSVPGGPSTPPPRRSTMDVSPSQVDAAQALAMPTRRVTGEMSAQQVAAVQQVVNQAPRRSTGEISPAQIAAMEAIAAQGAARRGTSDVSPAQVAAARSAAGQPAPQNQRGGNEVSPAQLAQSSALPDNALGRIVPAQKAVPAQPESPVQEIDRRPPVTEIDDDIEVDTDFDEPAAASDAALIAAQSEGLTDATRETISRILVESEVYIKYGLKQKAVDHLRKIFVIAPDHREARARYKTLLIDTEAHEEAVEVLLGMAAVAVEQGDTETARGDLEELLGLTPGHRRAKDLLAKLGPTSAKIAAKPPIEHELDEDELTVTEDMVTDDYIPTVATQGETVAATLSYEPSEKAAEIDLDADDEEIDVSSDAEIDDGLIIGADAEDRDALDDASMGGIIVGDDDEDGITVELEDEQLEGSELEELTFADTGSTNAELDAPLIEVETAAPGTSIELSFEVDDDAADEPVVEMPVVDEPIAAKPVVNEPIAAKPVAAKAAPPPEKARPSKAASSLDDDLDALINSAVPARAKENKPAADKAKAEAAAKAEQAKAEAAKLEAQRLEAAMVAAAAAKAEAARAEAARAEAEKVEAARAAAEAQAEASAAAARAQEVVPDIAPVDLSSEVAEIGFYLEQGLEDEARDMVANLLRDHPTHPDLLALRAKLDGTAAPALPPAAALDYEPEPEMLIGGDLGLDIAADLQSAAADDDLQGSLDDVFDAFKKGVAESVEEADYATHYDLGIAYKEMDLLADAIREFELAAKDPSRAIGALTMMGLCALQLGDTEHALEYFQRGLNLPSVTPQEAMALRYEIGVAYEGAGRLGDASKFYEKVHTWDAGFRDV
ncbi:MAG TPA: tetratricopeptide repeat protein, partial [Myxococcota bacterium]|nr:tetratricopeptide repeat protein [Myxococcota bacterium]